MTYPYTSTISGRQYYLWTADGKLSQESSPVHIEDIAHHLAHINRFTGATSRGYTVAEHSLLCASMAESCGYTAAWQLACLLHDAHEAYLNDMATPTKQAMRMIYAATAPKVGGQAFHQPTPWDKLEELHQAHVIQQLGLASSFWITPCSQVVKKIDLIALAHEKATIGPRDPEPWPCLEGIALSERWITQLQRRSAWNRRMIITHFLDRYHWLKSQIADQQPIASMAD